MSPLDFLNPFGSLSAMLIWGGIIAVACFVMAAIKTAMEKKK